MASWVPAQCIDSTDISVFVEIMCIFLVQSKRPQQDKRTKLRQKRRPVFWLHSQMNTFPPAHIERQNWKSGTLGSSLIAGLSMPHSVSWYFLKKEKFLFKKEKKKSTDDTHQSHHKEHSLTDRCWCCILLLRGSSRSQCKILGGALWLPQVLNQSRRCQCT